jgi:hypothetical protein
VRGTILKNKFTAITVILAAIMMIGVSYAHWFEIIIINADVDSGELDVGFKPGTEYQRDLGLDMTCTDGFGEIWTLDKDVGSTSVELVDSDLDGDYDMLNVTMNNVYPSYCNNIGFWVIHTGTVAGKVWYMQVGDVILWADSPQYFKLDISGDGVPDIEVAWGNAWGRQLWEMEWAEISFYIHVLQECPEDTTMSFTMDLYVIQYNLYDDNIPPPGYVPP